VRRKIATLLGALSLIVAVPITAQAQDEIKLVLLDAEVRTNETTYVSLVNCKTPTVATSPGFARPVKLEPAAAAGGVGGVAQVGDKPGGYTATAECGGKAYTAQFTVVAPPPPNWGLHPREVEPGGTINATTERWSCSPSLTSPGFAEPFGFGIDGALFRGHTKVITTPGTYTATLLCANNPTPYREQFTITGSPATTPPVRPRQRRASRRLPS
jgi:hypothetical protein